MITSVYLCDAMRTPFGRYGGTLSSIRADDLGAVPLVALMVRNPGVDWEQLADVVYGCANQAGEGNGNIARISSLLAGLPVSVPGTTINRLCGSGMDAIGTAARAIKSGEAGMIIAGGVESMSRAPYVVPKAEHAFAHDQAMVDTTSGWCFANKLLQAEHGIDSPPAVAEHLARALGIGRQAQDRYAVASLNKALAAQESGYFDAEITPVTVRQKNGEPQIATKDEQPQRVSSASMAELDTILPGGTVTSGNSARIGDGACAVLLACEKAAHKFSLLPKARVLGMASVGVPPRIAGIGAALAARQVLVQTRLNLENFEVIEIDEAFAAQSIAALRDWGIQDDDARVNSAGGAIALGRPLGACGARLVATAVNQLHRQKARFALCAACIGMGQGIALVIERI